MKNPNFIFLLARAHFRARCTRRQIRQKVHFQQGFQSMEAMFKAKKRGKKLVEGVKNFWIFQNSITRLICTKNHYHILKTHEIISKGANL